MKETKRIKRESSMWPMHSKDSLVFYSDAILGGVFSYDKIKKKTQCIIDSDIIIKNGITDVGGLWVWKDQLIILPRDLSEHAVKYNLSSNEITVKNRLTHDKDLLLGCGVFMKGKFLHVVPYNSDKCVYLIEPENLEVSKAYSYPDQNNHRSWLPFMQSGKIYIPDTGSNQVHVFADNKVKEITIDRSICLMSVVPAEGNTKEYWAYSGSVDEIFLINEEGKILKKQPISFSNCTEGEIVSIVPFKSYLILLHSTVGIIIFDLLNQCRVECFGQEKDWIKCEKLLRSPYIGYERTNDEVFFFPYGCYARAFELSTAGIRSRRESIGLPPDISDERIERSYSERLAKKKRIMIENYKNRWRRLKCESEIESLSGFISMVEKNPFN